MDIFAKFQPIALSGRRHIHIPLHGSTWVEQYPNEIRDDVTTKNKASYFSRNAKETQSSYRVVSIVYFAVYIKFSLPFQNI